MMFEWLEDEGGGLDVGRVMSSSTFDRRETLMLTLGELLLGESSYKEV